MEKENKEFLIEKLNELLEDAKNDNIESIIISSNSAEGNSTKIIGDLVDVLGTAKIIEFNVQKRLRKEDSQNELINLMNNALKDED